LERALKIGVLALQGGFAEHIRSLQALGVESFEIRKKTDLEQPMDGLILPGGESTVMNKLLHDLEMYDALRAKIAAGLPVFGTCAGLILLSQMGLMHIEAKRNAYGRQLGSFCVEADLKGLGTVPMTFIRAPYIASVGEGVEILAEVEGRIVAAREGRMLATAFHPELTADVRVHQYFIEQIIKY
jgi:5'-phosphate synthase pdxT subunit